MKLTKKQEQEIKAMRDNIINNNNKKEVRRIINELKELLHNKTGHGITEQIQSKNKMSQSNQDKEKEFWEKNQVIKNQLTNKANFDNRSFIADKKETKRKANIKGQRLINHVKAVGWDADSGETIQDFLKRYYDATKIALIDDGEYDYKFINTTDPGSGFTLENMGFVGKALKTIGSDGITKGVLNVLDGIGQTASKPSIKNLSNLGKAVIDTGKSAVAVGKDGPQAFIKNAGKNIAKEGIKQIKQ